MCRKPLPPPSTSTLLPKIPLLCGWVYYLVLWYTLNSGPDSSYCVRPHLLNLSSSLFVGRCILIYIHKQTNFTRVDMFSANQRTELHSTILQHLPRYDNLPIEWDIWRHSNSVTYSPPELRTVLSCHKKIGIRNCKGHTYCWAHMSWHVLRRGSDQLPCWQGFNFYPETSAINWHSLVYLAFSSSVLFCSFFPSPRYLWLWWQWL